MNIEKGIPVPPKYRKGDSISSILEKMSPGDSIELRATQVPSWRSVACKAKASITVRKTENGNYRLWRL